MLRSALLVFAALAVPVAAQTPLAVGTPAAGVLDGGSPAFYTMDLAEGQFVSGRVQQETVDVVVVLTAPDGTELARIDGPALGPEPFRFETDQTGTYTLAIQSFGGAAGRYTVTLNRAEPVATVPEGIVDQLLDSRSGDAPGALVVVVRDGEIAYQRAFGMANLTHGIPFTLETRTNIGSTSKQFTAYAIALLAERGALSLDDDVRTHVPELPDLGETVTLRHLLGHQSGYRDFLFAMRVAGIDPGNRPSTDADDIIRIVQRQPRLQNAPGTEFNYNNTGYVLLAEVVARVGGAPFPEWMDANVFQPIGMTRTVVRATPSTIVPNSAQGYARSTDGAWTEVSDLGGTMGAGGMYTTVGDLARWLVVLQTGGDHPDVVRQMTTVGALADGSETGYGLGLILDTMNGERRVQHSGADTAHRSMLAVLPELGIGVVVLTNSDARVGALAGRVIRTFAPDSPPDDFDGAADPEVAEDEDATVGAYAFRDALFDDYIGRYAFDNAPALILTFSRGADGGYLARPTGQGALEITPMSDSTFVLTTAGIGLTFHRDADGVVRSMTMHQDRDQRATRLDVAPAINAAPAADTVPADPSDYAARYWSDEMGAMYVLTVEDGELVMDHAVLGDVTFSHLGGDDFSIGRGFTVAFERNAAGAITALVVDANRTRDVRFERIN